MVRVIGSLADSTGDDASLTATVKVEVPACLGVPAIAPVEDVNESPLGSAPEATLQL